MWKCGRHHSQCVKVGCVRVGLHVLQDDIHASGDEVTAAISGARVVVHLALQSAGGIICTTAQCGRAHPRCIPIQVDEQ